MTVEKNIPEFIQIASRKTKIRYSGHKTSCYGCGSTNHEVANCPVNGKRVGAVYPWVDRATKKQTGTRNESALKTNAQSQAVSAQPDITSSGKKDLVPVKETGKTSKPKEAAASAGLGADKTVNSGKEKHAKKKNPVIATEKLMVVVEPAPKGTDEAKTGGPITDDQGFKLVVSKKTPASESMTRLPSQRNRLLRERCALSL